jgi:hypothetical protein
MYSLWNKARFASVYTPHYREDLPTMGYYATPARPIGGSDYRDWKNDKPTHFDLLKVTYNSLTELPASKKTEQGTINIPINGSYYKFRPLTSFEFYILSERRPKRIIRIRKKFSMQNFDYEKLVAFLLSMENIDRIILSMCQILPKEHASWKEHSCMAFQLHW